MAIGIITIMMFGLIDTFFISMLGTTPLAAIGFCMPVIFVVLNFTMGMVIGLSAVLARTLGKGDHHLAAVISSNTLFISLLLVLILALTALSVISPLFRAMGADDSVLPYIEVYMTPWLANIVFLAIPMVINGAIRSTGDMKTPSIIMIISGAINGILDPLLIFGIGPFPEMGMQGAAWATVISWYVVSVYALIVLRHHYKLLLFRISKPAELWNSIRPVLFIGLPAAVTNLLLPVAGAIMTAIISQHGTAAVAAFGVGSRIEMLAMVIIMALGAAITTFIGQNLGAGNHARINESISKSLRFSVSYLVAMYFILVLCSPLVARIFSSDEAVISLIMLFLLIVPLSYPAQGFLMLSGSIFNALHRPIDAMLLSVLRLFGFFIPCAWLGSLWFGLHGFFFGAVIGSLAASIPSYLWLRRYRRQYMMT